MRISDWSSDVCSSDLAFAAFDLFILARGDAERDYDRDRIDRARRVHAAMGEAGRARLVRNIIAGLPGAEESYTLDMLHTALDRYRDIDREGLRDHFAAFLRVVVPAAEEAGVRLGVHPDEPPRPLLGLPRVVRPEEPTSELQ